jgi:hypothetical protein
LPRPALQPPHQNHHRSPQTCHTLRMGRDWPVMSPNRTRDPCVVCYVQAWITHHSGIGQRQSSWRAGLKRRHAREPVARAQTVGSRAGGTQRRFPANHSSIQDSKFQIRSVSRQRFPADHSSQDTFGVSIRPEGRWARLSVGNCCGAGEPA